MSDLKLKFEYADALDFLVAEMNPILINKKNITDLKNALPNWNQLWIHHGEPLIVELTKLFIF